MSFIFSSDSRARALGIFAGIRVRLLTALCTALAQVWWRLWGIEIGTRLKVIGWTLVRRCPGSEIVIGPGCTFSSFRLANPSGLKRPCQITTLKKGARIQIGANCGLSATMMVSASSITLGNNVLCGANVSIADTDSHNVAVSLRCDSGSLPAKPIVIEDSVWLGMDVTVLKGVRIGAGSVVAAGSMVVKDLPAGYICGGVPAKPLRPMTAEELDGLAGLPDSKMDGAASGQ